jgi:hypothetical protein
MRVALTPAMADAMRALVGTMKSEGDERAAVARQLNLLPVVDHWTGFHSTHAAAGVAAYRRPSPTMNRLERDASVLR